MTTLHCASAAPTPRTDEVLCAAARDWISQHPMFRGRADQFSLHCEAGQVVVEGQVPSFHLRQILVEWIHKYKISPPICCRIEVICPFGLSGCSPGTRQRCALEFDWLGKTQQCVPTCTLSPGRYVEDGLPRRETN